MAVDTAAKRCSALTAWTPFSFGNVPSGTVSRPDSLWAYSGLSYASTVPAHSIAITIYGPARAHSVTGPTKTATVNSPRKTIE